MIRLGTVFSGIGAIEQAFIRMNVPHKIVFACDNGERDISLSQENIDEINKLPFEEKNQKVNDIYQSLSKPNNVER